MTRGTRKTRRLGTRRETCPPLETAHSQGPRYALKPCLFLGLFDVTRWPAVAVVTLFAGMALFYTVFGTVLTIVPGSISPVGMFLDPRFS